MPNYRRAYVRGGVFFFTLVSAKRRPILTTPTSRAILRSALAECRQRWPFETVAMVLLPDHLHAIWRLPAGDNDFSKRWSLIKRRFSQEWTAGGGTSLRVSVSQRAHRRVGVWQRRFWEHLIRDEDDLIRHVEYIHYNPVKHGVSACPHAWPYSTFDRYVKAGTYRVGWGCACVRKASDVPEHAIELPSTGE